jgi:GTP cyclohydrolase I
MKVEHTLTVVGKCPVNDCPDVYECVIRTDRVVMVEDILLLVKKLTESPRTQEELTAELAGGLQCDVETVGVHSGVKTKVVCPYPY